MRFYHDDCNSELDANGRCPKCLYHPDAQSIYGKHDTISQEALGLSANLLEQAKYWKNLAEYNQKVIDRQDRLIQEQEKLINLIKVRKSICGTT
jgi:hypothetical protein